MPVRVGLTPTPAMVMRLSGTMAAAAARKAAEEVSPGTVEVERVERLVGALAVNRVAVDGDRRAHGCQHALGVVTRRAGLADDRQALGIEAGQDDTALHLGAGDGHFVLHAAQRHAMHGEWGIVLVLATNNVGAHGAQRAYDAAHGPPADLVGAGEEAGEALPGQEAGQQADGRAGIAAVEYVIRLLQALQAAAMNEQFGRAGRSSISTPRRRMTWMVCRQSPPSRKFERR